MAIARTTWFGVVVEFDHSEINQIVSSMNSGAASVGVLSALLLSMGITGSASAVAGIVSGLLWLGGSVLLSCNSRQTGVQLTILWVGAPWCKPR